MNMIFAKRLRDFITMITIVFVAIVLLASLSGAGNLSINNKINKNSESGLINDSASRSIYSHKIYSGEMILSPDYEVHFYISKNYLYEDPRDKITATICWRNLPPPIQDVFPYYLFLIIEESSRIVIAGKILFYNYIDPSNGCLNLDIGYLMEFQGEYYLPVSGKWVAVIKTLVGDVRSLESYDVNVIDKYTISDVLIATYNPSYDYVVIEFSKDLNNALLLYRVVTRDMNGSVIRSTGDNPMWRYVWFNGSVVVLDVPGDPDPRESRIDIYIQKRGIASYSYEITQTITSTTPATETTSTTTTETQTTLGTVTTETMTMATTILQTITSYVTNSLRITITIITNSTYATTLISSITLITTSAQTITRLITRYLNITTIIRETIISATTHIETITRRIMNTLTRETTQIATIIATIVSSSTLVLERTLISTSVWTEIMSTYDSATILLSLGTISTAIFVVAVVSWLILRRMLRKI